MSGRVLLVTGARALLDTHPAATWARGVLERTFVGNAWTGVMHGGAKGPDVWADEFARRLGLTRAVYLLDGTVRVDGRVTRRWSDDANPHPLARNRAMVEAAVRIAGPLDVYVLGLRAGWSRTHGTDHTLTLARDAGLPTWAETCPAERGPQMEAIR